MNKIYSKVWNAALGQVVVASELASSDTVGTTGAARASLARHPLAIALVLMLSSGAAKAGEGVYISDGTDADCVAVHDDGTAAVTPVSDAVRCGTADASTQTSRVLFYGSGSDANSLSLGGVLSVNSGHVNLGGGASGNMSIGNDVTSATGGNATAIGSAASAANINTIAIGTGATSLGTSAIGIGDGAFALDDNSMAFGVRSASLGLESTAVGFQSNTLANYATAIGGNSFAMSLGSTALGYNTTATGTKSSAVGYGASATNTNGVAMGQSSLANGYESIAIGSATRALGTWSVAIGGLSQANGTSTTAVGDSSSVNGHESTALGAGARVGRIASTAGGADFVGQGTAVGVGASVYSQQSVALGYASTAGQLANPGDFGNVAIGSQSKASYVYSVAIGYLSSANAFGSTNFGEESYGGVALGTDTAAGRVGTAVGTRAKALGDQQVAIGYEAGQFATPDGTLNNSVNNAAVGAQAGQKVDGFGNVAMGGDGAMTQGAIDKNDIAGAGSDVFGNDNVGIGTLAGQHVTGNDNIALGRAAGSGVAVPVDSNGDGIIDINDDPLITTLTVDDTVAIGNGALANQDRAMALGTNAKVTVTDGVAIGSGSLASTAAGAIGFDPSTGLPSTNTGSAWVSTLGAVSIGADANGDGVFESTRQVSGVAAGTQATDAVNVAQLQAAQAEATSHYASVNDGGTAGGNWANDGAIGINSAAIGVNAAAIGDDSAAVGSSSVAVGSQSVTFGYQSNALGNQSMAMGGQSFALGAGSVALGYTSTAVGDYSIAQGYGAAAGNFRDIAIGYMAASDAGSTVIGQGAYGNGQSVAAGWNARANGGVSVAIGFNAKTTGAYGIAVGINTEAYVGAVAMGNGSLATDYGASAINAVARGRYSTAMGYGAKAMTHYSVALGAASVASGQSTVAIGGNFDAYTSAAATGAFGVALGAGSTSTARYATGLGTHSLAGKDLQSATNADFTTAVGGEAWATEDGASVLGYNSYAQAVNSTVLGSNAWTTKGATNSVVLGAGSLADRANTVSVGADNNWTDAAGVVHAAIDRQITNVAAGTEATDAVNKGQLDDAIATVGGNVGVLDAAAVKYDDSTTKDAITLGGAEGTVLNNVKAGTSALQAVNFEQLSSVAALLGGGVESYGNGLFGSPAYAIQGSTYGNVGDAFAAVDGLLGSLTTRVFNLEQAPGLGLPMGDGAGLAIGEGSHAQDGRDTAYGTGARVDADGSTAVGSNTSISAAATNAVAVGADASVTAASGTAVGQGASVSAQGAVALGQGSVADQANTVSVGSATQQRRVTNVATGTSATDAANVGQMQAGDAQAVATARAYTDTTATQTLTRANTYTDGRFQALSDQFTGLSNEIGMRLGKQDERIDRQGAMNAAMMNMAMNAANTRSERGRLGVGAGWQNGESALSVGYSKAIGERASFSIGGAFSSDDQSAGVGFGVDL
ncbi:beta strand repeat-containing protein [Lysobacter niastensis]|uniref:YadA-like family protein n=1 Tax=Lysobacter niastensis TaxID=380629 RepID=A0ABS0B9H5_9GAMM|nr:ESPR-type extended signal peptide-containing protein [Lysobacter niastensis]MBF6025663.1 YadA-like family protein [Lysobacter niastensis]